MILLRKLQEKDVSLMLEWMHDVEIQKSFQKDMLSVTEEQALDFCRLSEIPDGLSQGISIHFAIADEDDEYLGTISLKNIDIAFINYGVVPAEGMVS